MSANLQLFYWYKNISIEVTIKLRNTWIFYRNDKCENWKFEAEKNVVEPVLFAGFWELCWQDRSCTLILLHFKLCMVMLLNMHRQLMLMIQFRKLKLDRRLFLYTINACDTKKCRPSVTFQIGSRSSELP